MLKKENWTEWIPFVIIASILIVVYKTIDNLSDITWAIGKFFKIISPFLYGILIVYFLYIPCTKLEDLYKKSTNKTIKEKARLFSVLTLFLIVILLILFVIFIVLPIVFSNLVDFANSIPGYINNIIDYINNSPKDSFLNNLDIEVGLNNFANDFINQILEPNKIQEFTKGIIGFASGIFRAIISLVVSLYILLERDRIAEFFKGIANVAFKEKTRSRLFKYLHQINDVIFTFIASKGLDSIINCVATTTILLIFNVKYAFLLGIIAGIANFIPYLGSLFGVIFITIITIITGGVTKAIEVFIFLLIFQQCDGNFIEPRIMGKSLKISPLLVIFAVVVGGAYFGVIGMFLAVPIITILKQVLLEYMDYKKKKEA